MTESSYADTASQRMTYVHTLPACQGLEGSSAFCKRFCRMDSPHHCCIDFIPQSFQHPHLTNRGEKACLVEDADDDDVDVLDRVHIAESLVQPADDVDICCHIRPGRDGGLRGIRAVRRDREMPCRVSTASHSLQRPSRWVQQLAAVIFCQRCKRDVTSELE